MYLKNKKLTSSIFIGLLIFDTIDPVAADVEG
jgi:hypothetical protein